MWLLYLAVSTWSGMRAGGFWAVAFAAVGSVFLAEGKWLLGGILFLVWNLTRMAEDKAEVRKRSQDASELERRILAKDTRNLPRFALYLRPFISTGGLDTNPSSVFCGQRGWHTDFETVLSAAIRPELHLVGLNRPQDRAIVGAGYLFGADEDWFTRFCRFAIEATFILILPS